MSTKPDTDTGWSKEYPSLRYGSWFWLRDAPDAKPELHQLTGGHTWMESFGIVRDTTQFLGPVTASDFEQLIRLRKAASDALRFMEWNADPTANKYPDSLPMGYDVIAALREALAHTGEQP